MKIFSGTLHSFMTRKKNIIIISGFILVILMFVLIFSSVKIYTLQLRIFEKNELFFKRKIYPGDKFTIKYTHSVAQTPVWEMFLIDEQYQIILIETNFLDHGAGLPYTCFAEEIFIEEDNRFKIKNMHRIIYTPFYYRIGKVRENFFYFKNEELNLSSILGDELLVLEINRNSLLYYFLGGIFRW